MPIQVPVTQTGLEASIQAAAQRAGRNLKIDLGVSSRSIGALSQPLGKITGQADQFTKSMEAANARVLAFGASVGVLSAVAQGFSQLVAVTIQVEKNMADINSVLQTNSANLNKFKNDIFSVAKETGNSFQTVSDAALELSRQGLKSDEVLRRLKDSMILSRLSGLDAASAVEGLTAAVNSFSKEGITTSDVLNKISKTAAAFSVSERDLIEGFKRSASVAQQAGVSLDELGGIITAVQQKTARGGAVIGNAFKTIFTRIQRPDSLAALQDVGVAITDAQGGILPATKLIENLAGKMKGLNDIQVASITEKIGGGFQVGPLIAALDDITSKTSTFKGATEAMATAGSEAYKRNTALNQTLAASINAATVNLQELANTLGEIGVTDSLKNILSFFNSFATNVKDVLQGEGLGSDFAKGLVKGISAVLSGPGLLLFGAIIAKLSINFVQFGAAALKTFFNIGSAAKEIGAIQSTIASTLLNNKSIQTQILALEGNRVAQAQFFSTALNTQLATMEKMRTIAASIAPVVYGATTGAGKPRAAGGYMPTVMAEANDISKGVGGARSSDRPVVIPNFAFGGGKTGTMVANTGEHIIKNYGGSGGSAIFNRNMAKGGLPSGAQKIGAAGGFIPNFAAAPKDFGKYLISRGLNSTDILGYKKAGGLDTVWLENKKGLRSDYQSLSETDRRNLNIQSKQQSQEKNISQKSGKYGFIYPDALGSSTVQNYNTPAGNVVKGIPIQTKPSDYLYKEIRDGLVNSSLKYASNLGFNPDIVNEQNFKNLIDKNLNPGSIESAYGTVFESAFQASIGSDQKSNTSWDLPNKDSISSLIGKMKSTGVLGSASAGGQALASVSVADFKNALHLDNLKSIDAKVAYTMGKKASKGYIPNFADPLNEAISREISAGVNPSQVYIDQNNSLKGPMNPSGLMVANRRDEPSGGLQGINRARKEGANAKTYGAANGFVPNFQRRVGTGSQPPASLGGNGGGPDPLEKPRKDYLGSLLGLQLATSFLSGSFTDASSGAGLFAKRLTDASSRLSASVFVFEGLKNVGKEGSKLSAIMGKIGVAGQIAAVAFEGFNLGLQLWRDWTGVTAEANKSTAAFTDAVNAAGVSLNSLSQVEQATRRQKAKDVIYNISEQRIGGVGSENLQKQIAEFQYLSGINDPEKIKNILQKGGAMQGRKFGESSLINEDKAPEVMASYLRSKDGQEYINKLKEEEKKKTEAINKEISKGQAIEQVNLDLAKEQLKSALDIASARFRINDSLDEQLLGSEILKNLSEKETRDLKQKIALRDTDRKLADSTRSLLQDQIGKLSGVVGKEEERNKLKLEYAKLTDDDLTNQNKVRSLIEGINTLLTDGVSTSDSAKEIIEINLQNLFDTRDVEKDRLNLNKQNTEEYTNQKDVIDGIVESAKRMSAATSFEKTFAGQGQINVNELEIKRLESSKAGQGIKEQKQIDIRIKQLERSNVLLNNDNKVSTDLATAKEKAMAAIPNIDAAQTKKIQEQTSISGIQGALEGYNSFTFTEDQQSKIKTASQEIEQMGKNSQQAADNAIAVADANLEQTSKTEAVTAALTLFANSLQNIPQKLADLSLERGTTTSGKRLREIDYERTTLSQMAQMDKDKKTPEEIAAYQRQRSVKGIGQKFSEAFSETEFDRANRFSDTLVSGAEKFRDTMIDGMVNAIEQGGSLGDILQSAALDFAREMTRANMKNIFSSFMPSPAMGFASGGKITGGSGNKDDVPAMLMGGEYVMNKRAVSKYGSGFMEALNNGSVSGFADGGSVIRSRGLATDVINSSNVGDQTGEGGFQMPGYYGSGAITGKKDLLSYASQAYTSGAGDIIGGGDNSAYIDITPESVRLTNFGRSQGPMAAAVRESKEQSLDLYFQQLAAEKQAKEEEKAQKKAFKRAIITALITSAVGAVVGAGAAGFKAGVAGAGPDAGFMGSLGAGAKGVFTGGDIGGGVMAGGLKNLFSGNYQLSQISDLKGYQQYLSGNPKGIEKFLAGSASKSITGAGGGTLNAWSGDAMGPDGLPSFGTPFDSGLLNGPDGSLLPPIWNPTDPRRGDVLPFVSRATGGRIPQTAGIDTVPAMLSGGEFIMNAGATQRIGASSLNAMNSGASTETSSSAINDQLISKLDELIKITKESSKPVTVNVSSQQGQAGGDNQGEENKSEKDQNLSRKIKAAVIAVLQEEKRLGGVLRRS
jgi:TP901 family phage tail tape measure protein